MRGAESLEMGKKFHELTKEEKIQFLKEAIEEHEQLDEKGELDFPIEPYLLAALNKKEN